ncbi:DUF4190 domain-containing protein [Microbacterium limosum]|uniref:DUF4190 domain-containing protein n=1 Tax=Microbacterium limosum TaxID=3079935 RepID=A0AAU0ME09_9MICO|nr:DUF4190 domain-containing protein [Microbacterium sp. Y20]WOQ68468.1 DUF4190 domain-containing protein [Microbacterium sp. Y20]
MSTTPPYPDTPGYGGSPAAQTNTLAVVSLVSAIVGMLLVPLIGSIVAVITGHMSLGQLKTSGEQGHGLALAGTIIGWVGIGAAVLGIILLAIFLPLFFTAVATTTPVS